MDGKDTKYLIDGGHRTRTLDKYMKNEFSIEIDSIEVYYNNIHNNIHNTNRVPTENQQSTNRVTAAAAPQPAQPVLAVPTRRALARLGALLARPASALLLLVLC